MLSIDETYLKRRFYISGHFLLFLHRWIIYFRLVSFFFFFFLISNRHLTWSQNEIKRNNENENLIKISYEKLISHLFDT